MCSYITEHAELFGRAKGVPDWIAVTKANVCFDHPVSAPIDHAILIDFVDESAGPAARVAVELSAASATELVRAIQAALATGQSIHGLELAHI